jgi:ubiquinone/menaquinone biosynthesis C-methylase UbiE
MEKQFFEILSQESEDYFKIKDQCRKGLVKYLFDALGIISVPKHAQMLDIGCGTGVPTLALASCFWGDIKAIDKNINALSYLKKKISENDYSNRIKPINASFFEMPDNEIYDLVLIEGVLNVVGFEKGISKVVKLTKPKGHVIIHDENKDLPEKMKIIEKEGLKLLNTIPLDHKIWWNNYYKSLEAQISKIKNKNLKNLFRPDVKEIEYYRENPASVSSIYFVLVREI